MDISPIESYLKRLVDLSPSITSIWLIGSRAAGTTEPESDWDLLVFADEKTIEIISKSKLKERNIDLLVVYDGDNFKEPWFGLNQERKYPKRGSLTKWSWQKISEVEANYDGWSKPYIRHGRECRDGIACKALRIWP
jgi:predicted nucleotidyltransferase